MNTVDLTPHLKPGVSLPGFDLTAMPLADPRDRLQWAPVNPDLVQILRWPRETEQGGVLLPEAARTTRCGGWVLSVGDDCTHVKPGDQVTFQPLNFSRDEILTEAFVLGNRDGNRDTEIGYVMERDLDQYSTAGRKEPK